MTQSETAPKPGFLVSTLSDVVKWARAGSLWYYAVQSGCCADEVLDTLGSRYDLERFGCVPQSDPTMCDLLLVSGAITRKAAPYIIEIYEKMRSPKYVVAVGSCASCGGLFSEDRSYTGLSGVSRILPVDVFVPGCPPRPEAIMNGLITLQEKIRAER
jgi:NADH-quinone oxidoreductase subunit B